MSTARVDPSYLDLQARIGISKHTGGFPASVLKSLFGVKEVEPFA